MRAAPRFLPGFARDWPAVASTAGLPPHEAMRWLAGELAAGAGDLVLDAEVGCSYLDAELVPVSVPTLAAYLSEPRAAVEAPSPYLAQADLIAERPGLRERLLPPSLTDRTPRPYRTVAWLGGARVATAAASTPTESCGELLSDRVQAPPHRPSTTTRMPGCSCSRLGASGARSCHPTRHRRNRCRGTRCCRANTSPAASSFAPWCTSESARNLLLGNSSPVDPFAPRRDTERRPRRRHRQMPTPRAPLYGHCSPWRTHPSLCAKVCFVGALMPLIALCVRR